MMKRVVFLILMIFTVIEGVQCQQLNQRTFRIMFLDAVRQCQSEYKSPDEGASAIITFFTMPEMIHYTTKCFTNCLLIKFKLMDSTSNYVKESMQPFFNSLPESRFRTSLERNLDSCLQEKSDDACEKSYKFVQCFYKLAMLSNLGQRTEKP